MSKVNPILKEFLHFIKTNKTRANVLQEARVYQPSTVFGSMIDLEIGPKRKQAQKWTTCPAQRNVYSTCTCLWAYSVVS